MEWSSQQRAAIDAVKAWVNDENNTQQVFRLFGYAGTGKTTLAIELASDIEGQVLFAAFTGKAAHVMRTKGCDPVSTIHQLIYHPIEKSRKDMEQLQEDLELEKSLDKPSALLVSQLEAQIKREEQNLRRPYFRLNPESDLVGSALLIIDECSMVGTDMAKDLLGFNVKVLVLGDPAQLPPIGSDGFFITGKPDIMLTEIHRQAEGNPIIKLATQVRKGRRPDMGNYGESRVMRLLTDKDLLAADQIITGRNATRKAINKQVRKLLGFKGVEPVAGDRLVCLKNNHQEGLMNGAIWTVVSAAPSKDYDFIVELVVRSDDMDVEVSVDAFRHYFRGDTPPDHLRAMAEHFDYGYALTCHKSQGSQWKRLLVIDESNAFREDKWKWLYTAITRASDSLDLVLT